MSADAKQAAPERMLSSALLLVSGSAIFLDYWQYSREWHAEPEIWSSTLRGLTAAPQQYRIGVLKAAEWLTLHTPLAMRHALALFDFVALLVAAFVLRALLMRSRAWQNAGVAPRWVGAVAFVALLQYALAWLTWYDRPETLTIAAMLALTVWLANSAGNKLLCAVAQVLLALALGTIRADAAVALHAGLLLVCLTTGGQGLALGRRLQAVASALSVAAAVSVQAYIICVLYPQATYGDTPRFQSLMNVTQPLRIVPFLLFVAPLVWVLLQWMRGRFLPSALQRAVLVASVLFAVLWGVMGKIDEVRIFLPFAVLIAPIVAAMLMDGFREHRML